MVVCRCCFCQFCSRNILLMKKKEKKIEVKKGSKNDDPLY